MKYTHLIGIQSSCSELLLKEYLDIALVSVSYDIATAIFLSADVIDSIQQNNSPVLEQSFNMIADFGLAIYTDQPTSTVLYQQQLHSSTLADLQHISKHHFIF